MLNIRPRFNVDPWMQRIVVGTLSATLSLCIAGIVCLPITGHSAPVALTEIAIETVGVLGTVAVTSSARHLDRTKL
jgi:hypothetical protein